MRKGDHHGWTVHRVTRDVSGLPILKDVGTEEEVAWPHVDNSLVELLTPVMEAEWRLSDGSNARRCPHDGAWCHHHCGVDTGPPMCYRKDCGMALSMPHEGFPRPGSDD